MTVTPAKHVSQRTIYTDNVIQYSNFGGVVLYLFNRAIYDMQLPVRESPGQHIIVKVALWY